MGLFRSMFGGGGGPSERQIRRALKGAIQIHGDPATRVAAMERLVQTGRVAVEPILNYLRTEPEVTWPVRALREILPPEEFMAVLKQVLEEMAGTYTRWPEAKAVLIEHLPDEAFPHVRDTVIHFLQDEDDDVCIAAVDYLVRHGDEEVRERLLQIFLDAEARPRVRGRILDHFCDNDWPVKGYRKKMEEAIADPFYLTSKGTIRRRTQ